VLEGFVRAEKNVSRATKKLVRAGKNVSRAEKNVSRAEKNVSRAGKNVSRAGKNVSRAGKNVSRAEKKVCGAVKRGASRLFEKPQQRWECGKAGIMGGGAELQIAETGLDLCAPGIGELSRAVFIRAS